MAELYHVVRLDMTEMEIDNDNSPTIMREYVRTIIDDIKARKAVDENGVPTDVLQALGDSMINQLTSSLRQIYETGNIVDGMCD